MKIQNFLKVLELTFLVFIFFIYSCVSVSAFDAEKDLPEVTRWVNGAALSSNGNYLSDTWAIDKTGVSGNRYVLINQEGTEEFRIKNYPADINNGNTSSAPSHAITFKLIVPEEITNEVILTFENDGAEYNVSFNSGNAFSKTENIYIGEYNVSNIEVTGSSDEYILKDDFSLSVTDKNFAVSLEITKNPKATTAPADSDAKEGPLDIIRRYDTDGDLLWDAIKLSIAVVILGVIYLFIQHKRKKALEIDN